MLSPDKKLKKKKIAVACDKKIVGKKGSNRFVNFDPQDGVKKPYSESLIKSISEKALVSDLPQPLLMEVFERGLKDYHDSGVNVSKPSITPYQWAFARVNSFIAGGRALDLDEDLISEAKQYRITRATSNKSLGRLARRSDSIGQQAAAELRARASHVFPNKTEAAKSLQSVLHGKAKLDHSTAKKIIRTLGMNPKSAAAKSLTKTAKEHEAKQYHAKLKRQITREVKGKIKHDNNDLIAALKKVQAAVTTPPVEVPKPIDPRSTPGGPNHHLPRRRDINIDVGKPKETKKTGILSKALKFLKIRKK